MSNGGQRHNQVFFKYHFERLLQDRHLQEDAIWGSTDIAAIFRHANFLTLLTILLLNTFFFIII